MNVAEPQTWCVIPVKGFARAKSRLASILAPDARASLAERMFSHVAWLSTDESRLYRTLIATDDEHVERLAHAAGADVLRDDGDELLGRIVDRAIEHVRQAGAARVVVLMSDLPLLRAGDLRAALDAWVDADVVMAPDRAHLGTNLLGLPLAGRSTTCFGRADSFAAHLEAARVLGARVAIIDRPGLAFDLDRPEDYAALNRS